jgi:hypothetical protein
MATQVETSATPWENLGATAPAPQYRMTVGFRWKDDDGVTQQWGPTTLTFPNFLSQLTPAETAAFGEDLHVLMIRMARRRAGIDRDVTGGV